MDSKLTPIVYDKSFLSVYSNDVVKASQRMTLKEMKLLQIVISQIVRNDTDFRTYTTTAVEYADFMNTSRQNVYRDFLSIAKLIMSRYIEMKEDQKTKLIHWVESCEYDEKNHSITIRLSNELKPYLLELQRLYTQIELNTLISFKSYYTLRLYQLLVSEYGHSKKTHYFMTLEEIRTFFGVEKDKYKKPTDLLKKTLVFAINELNLTDLCRISNFIEIKSKSKGSPITAVEFTVDITL